MLRLHTSPARLPATIPGAARASNRATRPLCRSHSLSRRALLSTIEIKAGEHVGFYAEGGHPAQDNSIPEFDPRDIARLHGLYPKYQLEDVGPPLGSSA
jgi:hypothetical protein